MKLRIVNSSGEKVYEKTEYLRDSDFEWWIDDGEEVQLATIRIRDRDITPGLSSSGILYYEICDSYDGAFFSFSEYSLDISALPTRN